MIELRLTPSLPLDNVITCGIFISATKFIFHFNNNGRVGKLKKFKLLLLCQQER